MNKKHICTVCGRTFSRHSGLMRHVNTAHLGKNVLQCPICPICGESVSRVKLRKHLMNVHGLSELDACIKCEVLYRKKFPKELSDEIIEKYMRVICMMYENAPQKLYYSSQFTSFFKMVTTVEEFREEHIDIFISRILPWKFQHPAICNSKELAELMFPDDTEKRQLFYRKYMLEKNPYYDVHDSTRSPFSMNYRGYAGLSDEEKRERIRKCTKYDMVGRNKNQKEYWMKRGYSEEAAMEEVKKHRGTFSLEYCIKKYGVDDGTKIFRERQIRWQNTLKSKSDEEIARINKSKVYRNGSTSGVEREFLMQIDNDESHHNVYLKGLGIVDLLGNKKVIEFYGDYWHCNPRSRRFSDGEYFHPYIKMKARDVWKRDQKRIDGIVNAGYQVKIVWEMDYRANKEKTIQECRDFIYGTEEHSS